MTAKHRRRWFRFTLRTLFVLVTVLCVWLGWNVQIVRERKAVLREIERICGSDDFYYAPMKESDFDELSHIDEVRSYWYARISLVRRLLGDESCLRLEVPPSLDAQLISRMELAFPEAELIVLAPLGNETIAFRDSLYNPIEYREKNSGTIFKTGVQ